MPRWHQCLQYVLEGLPAVWLWLLGLGACRWEGLLREREGYQDGGYQDGRKWAFGGVGGVLPDTVGEGNLGCWLVVVLVLLELVLSGLVWGLLLLVAWVLGPLGVGEDSETRSSRELAVDPSSADVNDVDDEVEGEADIVGMSTGTNLLSFVPCARPRRVCSVCA